jgi:hypothetical protein
VLAETVLADLGARAARVCRRTYTGMLAGAPVGKRQGARPTSEDSSTAGSLSRESCGRALAASRREALCGLAPEGLPGADGSPKTFSQEYV